MANCKLFIFIYIIHSPALTAALRELATQIPQLKKDIQDGLLKTLCLVLMGKTLRHPGAPPIVSPDDKKDSGKTTDDY